MNNPPPHPLKRLLRKASRSRTSIATAQEQNAEANDTPNQDEHPRLERIASIAVTVPEDDSQVLIQEPVEIAEESKEPQSPVSPREAKRRASLVDKLKEFAITKKEKKTQPLPVEEVAESTPEGQAQNSLNNIRPVDVAKRIRDLLISSPPFYPTTLIASETVTTSSTSDSDQVLQGAKFLETLSNQTLMAGSLSQESVWHILERTQFQFQATSQVATASAENTKPDGSIMLCAPLIPDENSTVELAEFQLVKVPLDELDQQTLTAAGWWPPWEWGKKPKPSEPPTKTVRIWVPSTTKVSVQFCWWGFRIWLPEPVVQVLNDKQMEAAKRAAMISTALGWLVGHIPTAGLPPELAAVLTVAKALVPVIGYVSGFVAWYWSTVKGFDKGQGVVLSATWLLPVALIPGNWDYKPPAETPANPTPAPTTPTPTTPTPAPAPAPTTPAPAPTPSEPPTTTPTKPTDPTSPPVGTSPPPSIPPADDGSPIIVIPAPGTGVYSS